jgi:hypothetical protein
MLTANLMGGLGNVLFQVSACMAAAARTGRPFAFVRTATVDPSRPVYWDDFLTDLAPYLTPTIDCSQHKGLAMVYDPLWYKPILAPDADTVYVLHGYFQCPRYFAPEFGDIAATLGITRRRAAVAESFVRPAGRAAVAMHFRIGDYAAIQEFHPILTYEYYRDALVHIIRRVGSAVDVYYFCEDVDIQRVEATVARLAAVVGDAARFVRGATDATPAYNQMLMMSLCDHIVIANSTFSWWAAFLNQSKTKVVCYPSVWFGPEHRHPDIADELFRNLDWTLITCA